MLECLDKLPLLRLDSSFLLYRSDWEIGCALQNAFGIGRHWRQIRTITSISRGVAIFDAFHYRLGCQVDRRICVSRRIFVLLRWDLGWEANERLWEIVTIREQDTIPKTLMMEVPCPSFRLQTRGMVLSILVSSVVPTRGRVRVTTVEYNCIHTNRPSSERTVDTDTKKIYLIESHCSACNLWLRTKYTWDALSCTMAFLVVTSSKHSETERHTKRRLKPSCKFLMTWTIWCWVPNQSTSARIIEIFISILLYELFGQTLPSTYCQNDIGWQYIYHVLNSW